MYFIKQKLLFFDKLAVYTNRFIWYYDVENIYNAIKLLGIGGKMKKFFSVDSKTRQMTFDGNFFKRIFIDKPPIDDKLAGLSLRVAALLFQSLSDSEPRKLPPRTQMAKTLGVSTVAINKSLLQLDVNGFLMRAPEGMDGVVFVDEEKTKLQRLRTEERIRNDREQKKFSGKFTINPNYNITAQDYLKESVEEAVENFISAHPEVSVDKAFRSRLAEGFERQLQAILEEEYLGQKNLEQEENHD